MPDPVLLIQGTHGYRGSTQDAGAWWWPGDGLYLPSRWVEAARAHGLTILSRPGAPFVWATEATGWWPGRKWAAWKAAAEAARDYCLAAGATRVQVVAHSHGGQVAAYLAAMHGRGGALTVSELVTLGTPVRGDMEGIYQRARAGVRWWDAVHGGPGDWWQLAGEAFDGHLGWRRAQRWATRNEALPVGHGELMTVATWDRHDLWRFLR